MARLRGLQKVLPLPPLLLDQNGHHLHLPIPRVSPPHRIADFIMIQVFISKFISTAMDKKPKKKVIVHNESKSLWNYSLSPGWTEEEVKILKLALQKFGIGKWKSIIQSECLPGKSIGQIYIQTQRMLGQQSLGDFMGLQIDMEKVWKDNNIKKDVTRKNGCIINTGDNPNKEERKQRIEQNKEKYSISQEEIAKIKLPRYKLQDGARYFTIEEIENNQFTTIEKLIYFQELLEEVNKKIEDEETRKKIKID